MYLHIPFCETLCTFCGCNTSITKNKGLGSDYVGSLHREWNLYKERISHFKHRKIENLHLGGGTPTFLSAEDLKRLLEPIITDLSLGDHFEGSIEVDPRRTTEDQLRVLRALGFNRISLGVQDLDSNVQRLINRHQTYEQTHHITALARSLGYVSVNWDLIYGLPQQTLESIEQSVEKTLIDRPDRIALYSFALVPWIKPQQRLFTDEDLPQGQAKRDLYELARKKLLGGGYQEVGMDHFALETDALHQAQKNGKLHRNFMGYTDQRSEVMLGLGVSSISESPSCFHQNEKVPVQYQKKLDENQIPSLRGHMLSPEQMQTRAQILELMTTWSTRFLNPEQEKRTMPLIREMEQEGLLSLADQRVDVSELGKPFLRNICMVFDPHIPSESISTNANGKARVFSRSI
jgi:oxygen-independent coproporphyrinogen-3 oxidase